MERVTSSHRPNRTQTREHIDGIWILSIQIQVTWEYVPYPQKSMERWTDENVFISVACITGKNENHLDRRKLAWTWALYFDPRHVSHVPLDYIEVRNFFYTIFSLCFEVLPLLYECIYTLFSFSTDNLDWGSFFLILFPAFECLR